MWVFGFSDPIDGSESIVNLDPDAYSESSLASTAFVQGRYKGAKSEACGPLGGNG